MAEPPGYARLQRSATVGDGIVELTEPELAERALFYERRALDLRVAKFVPASGAASRMFKPLTALSGDEGTTGGNDEAGRIFAALEDFAFYPELERAVAAAGGQMAGLRGDGRAAELAAFILDRPGLGYGGLPKALVAFHDYPEGARTAAEEHLVEAAAYARGRDNTACIHFTVSEQHRASFEELFAQVVPAYEKALDVDYEIELSSQDPSTDSVAVDEQGRLFRDPAGQPLFRPGGHGSLLGNLGAMDADIVFIKNIDNCVPDRIKTLAYVWKKALAGFLLDLQDRVFDALAGLYEAEHGAIEAAAGLATGTFGLEMPEPRGKRRGLKDTLISLLDRPLRVCGMVRNVEAPGGGPFWVERDGGASLQIVETSQMDPGSAQQQGILAASTHFNPVDIVVSTRRNDGGRFELAEHVDRDSAFVVSRSAEGRELRSVERPGLWNGSMAGWLTVFVEVPRQTFNPVKTLTDLLGPAHRAG